LFQKGAVSPSSYDGFLRVELFVVLRRFLPFWPFLAFLLPARRLLLFHVGSVDMSALLSAAQALVLRAGSANERRPL
jgi:hypothetical protein